LTDDEAIVTYKGRVGFQQYKPKKRRRFGIKLYTLVYIMVAYLDQCENAAGNVTPTHGTVLKLMRDVEVKLLDKNCSWIITFHRLTFFRSIWQKNSCGTV
jgi:hypothetical protein